VPSYSGGHIPAIAIGPDSLARLAAGVAADPSAEALVIADEAVVESGYVTRVGAALEGRDVSVHVVPPGEASVDSVDDAAVAVRRRAGAVVVGIGGGTALDTAKLAAVAAGGEGSVDRYALGALPLPQGRPVIAIPTTAGTGSEVTRTCVVTDRRGRKVWMWGDELLPDLVLLDPIATVTMPVHVTASTGLDAVVHAVEAATGRRSNPLVAALALQAVRLVLDHLPVAVVDGEDLRVRQAMQEAALLAGVAIDGGGTGIAHAIGHALGTLAHVPHGVSVAVGLGAVLAWNVEGAPGGFDTVARAFGRPVDEVPGAYAALLRDAALPSAIRRVGPLALSVADLAATMAAEENVPMLTNSCRVPDDRERMMLADRTLSLWDELERA
jgi:alcohol dehydrogenase class IV